VYGFLSILAVTPCLGFALRALPLTPPEFAIGEGSGLNPAMRCCSRGDVAQTCVHVHLRGRYRATSMRYHSACRLVPCRLPSCRFPTCVPCTAARQAGLTIFAAVPTTLGVGEALVRASKGNAALALLLLGGTTSLGKRRRNPSSLS